MRKIGAYVLGVFLLLLLGAALVHPSLLVIADWLSPVFGSAVYGAMTMMFLMLGDPIGYPSILIIWVLVALIIGVAVRRRLGAVLVALLVWLTMLPILASVAFAIARQLPTVFQNVQGPLGGLPPLPSGMTITSLFNAPIVGKIFQAVLTAIGSNSSGDDFPWQIIGGMLTDFALKPVILIAGALIGVELGRLAQKRGVGFSLLRPKMGAAKVGAALLIAFILSTAVTPPVTAVQFSNEAYIEGMVGALDRSGRSYLVDVFMDTNPTLQGLGISQSDANGLAAAIVVSQIGVAGELQKQLTSNPDMGEMSSLVNLMPQTFAVVVYVGVQKDTAAQRSQGVSRVLSSTYKVDLWQVTSFTVNPEQMGEGGNMPIVTVSLYQSGSDIGTLAQNFLNEFSSRGGLAEAIKGAVNNGRLIPGETSSSATGTMFVAGFVNADALRQYVSTEEIPSEIQQTMGAFLSGQVSFAGGVSFWDHGKQPTGGSGDLDLLNLLGTGSTPTYSSTSDFSFLATLAPPGENMGGGEDTPNVKISTSVPLSQDEMKGIYGFLSDMGWIGDVKQGVPTPGDMRISVVGVPLPLDVDVTKTISGGDTPTVTVTVTNRDTQPMTDVTIDDRGSLSGYTTGIDLVSGAPVGTWDIIPPGESRTITYSVRIDNPGVYTLEPADLSYTGGGVEFSDTSNKVETPANRPLFIFAPFDLVALTWVTGSQLLDSVTGRGTIIMAVITLAFVAIVAWDGFMSYRRWTRRGAPEDHPQESEGKSEAPQ